MTNKIQNFCKEFLKGIGNIFLFILLSAIGSILFGKYYNSSNTLYANLSQIATYLLMFIVFFTIHYQKIINDFKSFKKEYIKVSLKNWILGLGIMIIANIIITSIVHNISTNETLNRELLTNYPYSSIISMIIIGPFIEELVFRLSFKKAFNKWYTFSLVTALLFGLAHIAEFKLLEFLFVIPYGALGFFFAKSMYETDNVFTSYISHLCHNAMTIFIILFL